VHLTGYRLKAVLFAVLCAAALVFGLAGTARALKEKPAPYLRNE